MGPERIELSAKERERLKVLQQVEEGHLRQIEAARQLHFVTTERAMKRSEKFEPTARLRVARTQINSVVDLFVRRCARPLLLGSSIVTVVQAAQARSRHHRTPIR